MKYTIFYSWQSDLPNNTNRGFIGSVLEEAIGQLHESDFEVELTLDRDTQNIPGSPNIVKTIIDKIRKCDVFVADLSIIHQGLPDELRASPNPNVLLELGYALATLGTDRVILFFNESYGDEKDIPFDIRQNKRINYKLLPEDEKAPARKSLSKIVSSALREIVLSGPGSHRKLPVLSVALQRSGASNDEEQQMKIRKLKFDLNVIIQDAEKELADIKTIDGSKDPSWNEKLTKFESDVREFVIEIQKNPLNYYLSLFKSEAETYSLLVSNVGNLAATDVRVSVVAPEGFIVTEKYPKVNLVVTPKKPRVTIPATDVRSSQSLVKGFVSPMFGPAIRPNLASLARTRTHACYVKEKNEIYFWADKILHKHQIHDGDDSFYIIPKHDWSGSEVELKLSIFCSEQEEWQKKIIMVPIYEL